MNASETLQSGDGQVSRPQFTATLLLKEVARPSFAQIRSELERIAPQAQLENWNGPVTNPAIDPGIEILSLNGERMSVLVIDGSAPAAILQAGPFPNPLWPNAKKEAADHKTHILVIAPEDPVDREAALAKARAVTVVAGAIARIVPAIGISWADGANLMKAEAFVRMSEKLGQPGTNAVPFWIRLKLAQGSPASTDRQTLTASTLGLRIFGLRELEYAPAPLEARFIMQHAYSVSEYLLRSGKRLGDGETIGVDGQVRFAITHADNGEFGPFPVARLSLLPKTQ